MVLTESEINRIENEALIFAEQRQTDGSESSRIYKSGCSFGYANGAINEAERAEGLVKALEYFKDNCPKGSDFYNKATTALSAYQSSQKVK